MSSNVAVAAAPLASRSSPRSSTARSAGTRPARAAVFTWEGTTTPKSAGASSCPAQRLRATRPEDGGGVWVFGEADISESTISGNSAASGGGGVFVRSNLTLNRSTVTGNSARFGGGITVLNDYGLPSAATIRGTIVAGNSASQLERELYLLLLDPAFPTVLTLNHSLIGHTTESGLVEAPLGAPTRMEILSAGPFMEQSTHGLVLWATVGARREPTTCFLTVLPSMPGIKRRLLAAMYRCSTNVAHRIRASSAGGSTSAPMNGSQLRPTSMPTGRSMASTSSPGSAESVCRRRRLSPRRAMPTTMARSTAQISPYGEPRLARPSNRPPRR